MARRTAGGCFDQKSGSVVHGQSQSGFAGAGSLGKARTVDARGARPVRHRDSQPFRPGPASGRQDDPIARGHHWTRHRPSRCGSGQCTGADHAGPRPTDLPDRTAARGPSISASKSSRSAVCPSGCWCWATVSPAISSEHLNGSARTSLNTRSASWPSVSGGITGTPCSRPERTCRRGWWRQSRTAFPHLRLFRFVGRYRQVPTICNVPVPRAVWASQISSSLKVRSPQARTDQTVC